MAAVMVVVHHANALAGPEHTRRFISIPAEVMDSGVAVFFVLSGFLIYRPFAVAHHHGSPVPGTVAFWWRRLLRLVPAYWAALTFFWVVGSYDLGGDWWRYYFFGQIYSRNTTLGGLVQAWSLCTEVTFYLLVPVWAAGLRRLAGRRLSVRTDLVAVAMLYVAGFLARAIISSANPTWRGLSFQWLPTNLDLFATGMAAAIVSVWAADDSRVGDAMGRLARRAELWWAGGLALFAWYAIRVGGPTNLADPNGAYTGFFWQQRQFVLGLFTLLLMVPAVFGPQDRGPVRSLLRWRPIAWVGTISYGLYLWHFDWMKRALPQFDGFTGEIIRPGWMELPAGLLGFWYLLAIGMGIGCLTAALSWSLLEKPLQRFKNAVRRR